MRKETRSLTKHRASGYPCTLCNLQIDPEPPPVHDDPPKTLRKGKRKLPDDPIGVTKNNATRSPPVIASVSTGAGRDIEVLTRFKERFAGTPSPDIESFFARFDHFCAVQNHDDKYKCNTFQLLLEGKAFVTYKHFSEEIKRDYEILKENMIAHYGKVRIPREKAMQSIGKLFMKENEKVQEFQDRVLEHTEDLQMNESQKKIIFYNGLLPYIKRYVEKEKPNSMKTMKDTLLTAKIAEFSGLDLENEPVTKGELNKFLETITTAIKRDTPQISSIQPPQAREEARPRCRWCGAKNHTQHRCTAYNSHLAKQRQHQGRTGPTRVAGNQPRNCLFCGMTNHYAVDCFKLQRSQGTPSMQVQNTYPTSCTYYNKRGHTGRRRRSFKYHIHHNDNIYRDMMKEKKANEYKMEEKITSMKEEVNSEEVKSKLEEMDIRINDVAMVKNYILNEDGIKDKLVLRWMC